ncbi:hypothetical protein, variant [Aphanomyces invadans]|uniref:Elongator complex protein 6 n=1 Tax=Aphanomyces invadans TaxID=157072 RepID=A0A024UFE1_9STRA|nr:hypothetical protein, variant [Aphanomyces invadans]ETW04612.1 hypothetical protein, variant [Aphanomyces invadans]|eukprot:XP_008866049.1 hypothetical protein, variant [Aphanomyces invadans]
MWRNCVMAAAWPTELEFTPLNLPRHEFVVINDVVEAPGAYFMHHITSMFLKAEQRVCVVALANTLEHYASIGRKLGVNVFKAQQAKPCAWLHIDGFSHPYDWCNPQQTASTSLTAVLSSFSDDPESLEALFCQLRDFATAVTTGNVCIVVDDASALVDQFGVPNTLTFLRYCRHLALMTETAFVVLNHGDVEGDDTFFVQLLDICVYGNRLCCLDSGLE